MTGRMPLPPRWALGYHQCRYSYYPESRVRFIAHNFRERRIPADVIWLDIHYQDGYKPFTWDRERFPDPAAWSPTCGATASAPCRSSTPTRRRRSGYEPYDTGLAGDHFVKNPDGSVYEAPVWPSQAEKNPGPSVFPDFSKPAAREWWGGLYKMFTDIGIAGIWNDMNEPAVFETATGTMPLDVRHRRRGPADRPSRDPQRLRAAQYAGHLRGASTAAAERAAVRAHARLVTRADSATPRSGRATTSAPGSISARRSPCSRAWASRGCRSSAATSAASPGAPSAELYTRWLQARRVLPVHAHAHDVRHARPGAVVVRDGARGDQPLGDRAALPACCRTSTT